jgi:hypothetical protein
MLCSLDEILHHNEDRNISHSVQLDIDDGNNVQTAHLLFYIDKTFPE